MYPQESADFHDSDLYDDVIIARSSSDRPIKTEVRGHLNWSAWMIAYLRDKKLTAFTAAMIFITESYFNIIIDDELQINCHCKKFPPIPIINLFPTFDRCMSYYRGLIFFSPQNCVWLLISCNQGSYRKQKVLNVLKFYDLIWVTKLNVLEFVLNVLDYSWHFILLLKKRKIIEK